MTGFGWWNELAYLAGQFMCCICFEGFPVEQAWQDADGQRWDMCPACGWEQERARSGRHT